MDKCFYSTGGIKDKTPSECVELLIQAGIQNIELSSGLFEESLLSRLKSLKKKYHLNFRLHNYFPPPKKTFVLNLGSLDSNVASRSIEHIQTALELANELEDDTYAFHAGFLMDPKVNQLGKRIKQTELYDRDESTKLFIERVVHLNQRANELGVRLLVENNVLSEANFAEFKGNPLLMVDPDEILNILKQLPSTVGLLLDIAHFKVSAQSLGFEMNRVQEILPYVRGYHLSDNDGTADTNEVLADDCWFWKYAEPIDYICCEVYEYKIDEIKNQIKTIQRHCYEKTS